MVITASFLWPVSESRAEATTDLRALEAAEGYGSTSCKDVPKDKVQSWYRPDIDGLRAVAVIAVIIYHMQNSWLPGGFMGVDMFFVISGYVVTGSVHRHPGSGICESFTSFYVRRIKRIVPNLLCVVIFTATFMAVLTPPSSENLKSDFLCGVFGIFGLSNNYLAALRLDYFHDDADDVENPFMHTWSLGVEEQFYLLYPVLFLVAYGSNREQFQQRGPAGVISSTIRSITTWSVFIILSMLTFILLETYDRNLAFYLLPSRFWQLAAGAVLLETQAAWSIWVQRWKLRIVLQIVAVASMGVVFSGLATQEGRISLLGPGASVLAAVCYIMAGALPQSHLNKCFSHKIPVYVGKLSYSLYLWHWPILTLMGFIHPPGSVSYFAKASLLFIIASIAAYSLVERVCRSMLNPRPVMVFAAAIVAMCGACFWLMTLRGPLYGNFFVAMQSAETDIPLDMLSHVDIHPQCSCQGITTSQESQHSGGPSCFKYTDFVKDGFSFLTDLEASTCDFKRNPHDALSCIDGSHHAGGWDSANATSSIYLFGDSHAGHLVPGMRQAAASAGLAFKPMWFHGTGLRDYQYRTMVARQLEKQLRTGDIVVLSHGFWRLRNNGLETNSVLKLHNITAAKKAQMLLIGDLACKPGDLRNNQGPKCIPENPISDQRCSVPRSDAENLLKTELPVLTQLSQQYTDIHLLDLGTTLCTDTVCLPVIPRTKVPAIDGCHLTMASSYYLWPRFCHTLKELSK
jgi:peptidoglycan/LPS O-acetylase OafA/YrhL